MLKDLLSCAQEYGEGRREPAIVLNRNAIKEERWK
jgi:hypothetical protein